MVKATPDNVKVGDILIWRGLKGFYHILRITHWNPHSPQTWEIQTLEGSEKNHTPKGRDIICLGDPYHKWHHYPYYNTPLWRILNGHE